MIDDQQRAREEFETWARSKGMPTHRRDYPLSERLGEYGDAYTAKYWETWQAAITAALRAAPEGFVMVPVEMPDMGDAPRFVAGDYCRRNLDAVMADLQWLAARQQGVKDRPPIDGCTESNCKRCRTHPNHRGDIEHAGIGWRPDSPQEVKG